MSNDQWVSPENDRPRQKGSEYDPAVDQRPVRGVATTAELLREIYATDPDDPGPGRVNARHRW